MASAEVSEFTVLLASEEVKRCSGINGLFEFVWELLSPSLN